LSPNKIYQLLRGPDALSEAAESFRGVQLLDRHAGVRAINHPRDLVIGRIGDDVTFDGAYLTATVFVSRADAIRDIETGARRCWSAGYRYTPDMTPGTYRGAAYDGVMRAVIGNHCALVPEGRCGAETEIDFANLKWRRTS
jgi:hypothetical protein